MDQMPLAEGKCNTLMNQFTALKGGANAGAIRSTMLKIERIIDSWARLAGRPFDKETKVGELRGLVPNSVWQFSARDARQATTFSGLTQLVMKQQMDPKDGNA